MFERLLNETEKYLHRKDNALVSIRQVWKELAEEGKRKNFSIPKLADFECLLDADRRFECISGNGVDPGLTEEEILDLDEMEKLGLLQDIQVRLRSVTPVREDDDEDGGTEISKDYDQLIDHELEVRSSENSSEKIKKKVSKKPSAKSSPKKGKK